MIPLIEIDVGRRSIGTIRPNIGTGVENMENNTTESEQEKRTVDDGVMPSLLVGYVRKSNAGGAIKLSINTNAIGDCETYTTSDGQSYVPLVISLSALRKVIDGERAVTTMSQLIFD
jgi:hypothetical protein